MGGSADVVEEDPVGPAEKNDSVGMLDSAVVCDSSSSRIDQMNVRKKLSSRMQYRLTQNLC